MNYDNKKLALSVFWLLLGAVLAALSVAGILDDSVYAGMGGTLIAVGALQIGRNVKYRRDGAYREKIDTEAHDERNRFLRMKSWAWTGYVVVIAEAVGSVVALILGRSDVQRILGLSVCLIVVVYLVFYTVFSKRY